MLMELQDFLQVARRHIIDSLECLGSYLVVNTFMGGQPVSSPPERHGAFGSRSRSSDDPGSSILDSLKAFQYGQRGSAEFQLSK